jgi:hypothetical protein
MSNETKGKKDTREKDSKQTSRTDTSETQTGYEIKAENLTPEERAFLEKNADKLSPTTLRAKWINDPNEHEDYPGQSLATQNPEVIKRWAEERQAVPASVPGTEHGDHLGVLAFDFPGYGGQKLEHVSWDEWLKTFKKRKLVFLFQEHMKNGKQSNFFHLDSPTREHD